MCSGNRSVDAGKGQLWLSLRHHVRHDLVPHAALCPAAEPQIGMVPVAKFSRDRAPFGAVVEPPDDRLDGATLRLAWACTAQADRRDCRLELGPLRI